jgi:hypothetical protein
MGVDIGGTKTEAVAVADDGSVANQLIPSHKRPGWFGLARLSFPMLESNVSKAEFESLWQAGIGRKQQS